MEEKFRKTINGWIDEVKQEFNVNFENYTNVEKIKEIMKKNDGYITTKEVTQYKIGRDYLKKMVDDKMIEKVDRGIYISKEIIEDNFYTLQIKYPKIVYSHFTALYFQSLTETVSNNYDITVPNNFYAEKFKNHNIFYIKKEWLELGLIEIKDNYNNVIRVYDIERCICDLIRSKKRLDIEQVKKSVRQYVKRKDKNIENLIKYSKIMEINEEVMDFVGMYYE